MHYALCSCCLAHLKECAQVVKQLRHGHEWVPVAQPQQGVAGQGTRQGRRQVRPHHLHTRGVEGVQPAHELEAQLDAGDGVLAGDLCQVLRGSSNTKTCRSTSSRFSEHTSQLSGVNPAAGQS